MMKTLGIVSLSSGIIGEPFVRFEVEIGIRRLEESGLKVKFMPNALNGMADLQQHPEKRAQDLLQAFRDREIDMILCAIGGDDTYRLLPYLFEHDELADAVTNKVFLGFSDTTINHLMLHKVGLPTFYGQAFLPDLCELSSDMLPYTLKYWKELISLPIQTKGLSYYRVPLFFPVKFWADALIPFMISLTETDIRICRNSAGNIISFPMRKTGKDAFSFWKPAKKNRRRKSFGRLSDT